MPVSHEDVRRCYLLLLEREPESLAIVKEIARSHDDVWQLIEDFLASPEFRNRRGLRVLPLRVDVPASRIDVDVTPGEVDALRDHVQKSWEHLGRKRAHFSVLARTDFLPASFAGNEAAFWATGEQQVAWLERILARHGMTSLEGKVCIDFGCGVGRLTEPLARRFRTVHGYDISEPHLEIARKRITEHRNVELHRVRKLPVSLARADVFFSLIVLQHNPPPVIALLIRSALECLEPGGIAVFQVPTYELGYSFTMADYSRRKPSDEPDMEMHCIPQQHVFRIAAEMGCQVLEVREHDLTGRLSSDVSNVFVILSPPEPG